MKRIFKLTRLGPLVSGDSRTTIYQSSVRVRNAARDYVKWLEGWLAYWVAENYRIEPQPPSHWEEEFSMALKEPCIVEYADVEWLRAGTYEEGLADDETEE